VSAPAAAVASLDELAQKQRRLAPGMRELARGEGSSPAVLPTLDHDECVRVAFASRAASTVRLVARDGAVLAASEPSKEASLDARGPVCFRRGTEPRLEFDGDAGDTRYVVWGAP